MAAGAELRAFNDELGRSIRNHEAVRAELDSAIREVESVKNVLDLPGDVSDAVDAVTENGNKLVASLNFLSKMPGVGGFAKLLKVGVDTVNKLIGTVGTPAEKVDTAINETKLPFLLGKTIEVLNEIRSAVLDSLGKQKSVQTISEAMESTFDAVQFDKNCLSTKVDDGLKAVGAVTALKTFNEGYTDVRDDLRDLQDTFDNAYQQKIRALDGKIDAIDRALSVVTKPLDTAYDKIKPVAKLLNTPFDGILDKAIDWVIDKLGLNKIIDKALEPIKSAIDFNFLTDMEAAIRSAAPKFSVFAVPQKIGDRIIEPLSEAVRSWVDDVKAKITTAVFGEGTHVGTDGAELLESTIDPSNTDCAANEVFAPLAGNDTVNAGHGDDVILASAGDDTVDGGSGKDRIVFSGRLAEYAWTVQGEGDAAILEFVHVNPARGAVDEGRERVTGVEEFVFSDAILGRDFIVNAVVAKPGDRVLEGTNGADFLRAEGANQGVTILGKLGNDRIHGSRFSDVIDAGWGNDSIQASLGQDTIDGGGGTDTLIVPDGVASYVDVDLVRGTMLAGPDQFDLRTTTTLKSIENVVSSSVTSRLLIKGDDSRNFISLGDRGGTVDGRGGNDTIVGGKGGDNLSGGESGNDFLDGAGGDDWLYAGSGLDTLLGGAGSDLLIAQGIGSQAAVFDGGEGRDVLTYQIVRTGPTVGPVKVDLSSEFIVRYNATGDRIVARDKVSSIEVFGGSAGDDTMIGAAGPEHADKEFHGQLGNDFLESHGQKVVDGFEGDDTIRVIWSGQGVDTSILRGGEGHDRLELGSDPYGEPATSSTLDDTQVEPLPDHRWELIDERLRGYTPQREQIFEGTVSGFEEIHFGDALDEVSYSDRSYIRETHLGNGSNLYRNFSTSGDRGDNFVYGGDDRDFITVGFQNKAARIFAYGNGDDDVFRITHKGQGGLLDGGDGKDRFYINSFRGEVKGGEGFDTIILTNNESWLRTTVDLAAGTVTSNDVFTIGFTFSSIEQFVGSLLRPDVVNGTDNGDIVFGLGGNDIINGLGGDDELYGNAGNDSIDGGDGDDTVYGGTGSDTLRGGNGIDMLSFAPPTPVHDRFEDDPQIKNHLDGEVIRYVYASLGGWSGSDDEGLYEADSAAGVISGFEQLQGSVGNDLLYGHSSRSSFVSGGLGNDSVTIGTGNDTVLASDGADTIKDFGGDDFYILAGGRHTVTDTSGFDSVYFGDDATSARVDLRYAIQSATVTYEGVAGSSAHRIAGVESFTGTVGADYMEGSALRDVFDGADGTDRLFGNNGDDLLRGGAGADLLSGGNGNDTLEGGAGADVMLGGDGNDRLDGGGDADVMIGGRGDDTYVVDHVGDQVYETRSAADTRDAGGHDRVIGGISVDLDATAGLRFVEDLQLTGSAGLAGFGNALDNLLVGNGGANHLEGRAGDDTIDGGLGADIMLGGAGDDVYIVDDAGDRVVETVSLTNLADAGGHDRVITSRSFDLDTAPGARFVEDLELSGRGNVAGHGNGLANTIIGTSGHNILAGRGGDDTILGGDGIDRLDGGDGDDRLQGDRGIDFLTGGRGRDSFVFTSMQDSFNSPNAADVILDFVQGEDVIDLSAIDASLGLPGNDAFEFLGTASAGTSPAGAVTYQLYDRAGTADDFTLVRLDVDSDDGSEMVIRLAGLHQLRAQDFVL